MKTEYTFLVTVTVCPEPSTPSMKAPSPQLMRRLVKNGIDDALGNAPSCEYLIVSPIGITIVG
jgi:hypothetical protein